jgi:hypothetical protein
MVTAKHAAYRLCGIILAMTMVSPPTTLATTNCAHQSEASQLPLVRTIAGSGLGGTQNGTAAAASFVRPVGVASAPNGDIYVADSDAQNLRVIRSAHVMTFAGPARSGGGGFVDGPARDARFRNPTAIAVANDGTVYVADSGNHAIRRIRDGKVSTLAAHLVNPQDIAVDEAGIVYVADSGVGIKRITPHGVATTLPVADDKQICGIAARGQGADLKLAYTDSDAIHFIHGSESWKAPFQMNYDTDSETFLPIRSACRLAILGNREVVVTDSGSSTVRFIRLTPRGRTVVRVLAGPPRVIRYADGPLGAAIVNDPGGIVLSRGGNVIFADTANRRIREIVGLDARDEATLSGGGFAGPPGTYRIATFGSSFTFWDVLWRESIQGQIEAGLLRDRTAIGLAKCPSVTVARSDGTGVTSGANFIENFLGDGETDLVIFFISDGALEDELKANPNEDWSNAIPPVLHALKEKLARQKTQLLVVVVSRGKAIGPEYAVSRASADAWAADFTKFADVISSSGVRTINLLSAMRSARAIGFQPLVDRDHFSPSGSTFIGLLTLEALESWRPWSH